MSELTKNKNPSSNKQSIIITKHKSISAIKQINYPKTKFQFYNDNTLLLGQLKNTSHHTLSKKQLLLKLQHIKDLKQSQYQYHHQQSHLTRSNTDNLLTYHIKEVSSQIQNKRTIYSNLHKRSIERQSSAKKSIGQASQNQFLNQIKNNYHKPNTLPIIENHLFKQKRHYQTQRKKVTSLGAGFRKRTNNIQAIKLLSQKIDTHQYRITRTTSTNKLSKLNPIQMQQKRQEKRKNRNLFKQTFYRSPQKNPMVLIEMPTDYILQKSSSYNTEVKRINEKKPSISLSIKSKRKQKSQSKNKNHKQCQQLFKIKRIKDIDSLIKQKLKQQQKQKVRDNNKGNNSESDQHEIISLGDNFFEMNGFGIVSSLQRFDILSTQDRQGVVFNKLFRNQLGQCPYFVNQSYRWIRVIILGYDTQMKRVAVKQIDNQQKQQPNDKQSILLQKRQKIIYVSRLSVRVNEKRVKQLRKQIYNSNLREWLKQLTQLQLQLAYEYLTQPYWSRVTQARQRLIQFRNSQKYLRYLNKLITTINQQQQLSSLVLLFKQLQPTIQYELRKTISKHPGYIPSLQLNFKKRVNLLQAMMTMIRQQCILIYDMHFVVMRDMYYYPQKYKQMQLLIYKVEDYLYRPNNKERVILSKQQKRREFIEVKRYVELNHYSNIPNLSSTVQLIINSIHKLSKQFTMNIFELIRTKLTLNKLTNNILAQNSNMIYQQQKQQSSSISLQFFIQTIQSYLSSIINSLNKYRQNILQEITYNLQQSFSFTYTTKTPQFIQSVNTFTKSIMNKCFKLINYIFIQTINTQVYKKTLNEFIGWMKQANSWYLFKLSVFVKCTDQLNYSIQIQPKQQQFQQKIINTFLKYLQDIQDINDLQAQLKYQQYQSQSLKYQQYQSQSLKYQQYQSQSLRKILIYDNMIQILKNQLHDFTYQSYLTLKDSLNSNVGHYLHTYFNPYKFSLLPFTLQSLESYHVTLLAIQKDIQSCQTYLIHEVTIFRVNLKQMNQQLLTKMRKQHRSILKKIQKQVSIQIYNQYDLFLDCRKRLSQKVNDEIQYIQCRKYMNNQCQQLLHSSIKHYQIVDQYYQLFQSHFYQYSFQLYIKHTRIIKQRQFLIELIEQKLKQLLHVQSLLLQKINQQRDTLSIDIDDIRESIIKVIEFSQTQHLPKYYVETNKCYFKLEEIKNMLSNINLREKLLKQQSSTFKLIEQMYKQLLPYYQLHQAIHQVLNIDSQWKTKPLLQLSYSHIHNILINNLNTLQQVSKILIQQKNSSAISFADLAINIINKNLSSLWIVQHLTKQAMLKKPNILKQALTYIFQNKQYILNELTITDILGLNLTQQKKAFIIEKSLIAQKIYNLQKLLQQTVNNTKNFQLNFLIVQKSNNKINRNTNHLRDQNQNPIHYVNQTKVLYLISCLKQQKQSVYIIQGNEVAQMISKKISYVLNKLNVIQSTLQHILQFQQLLTKINKILQNPQIRNFIAQQYIQKYEKVIKSWQKIVQVFVKQPQLWEAVDSEGHKSRLRQGINGMNQILTKIQSIVDEKMGQCPKLYFVPKKKLYDILQQQPHKQLSVQILQVLYGQGFRRLIYEENIQKQQRNITGVQGQLGQMYLFRRAINSLKIFWIKYEQIDQQISLLMKQVLNSTIDRVLSKQQQSDSDQHKGYLISQLLEQNIKWTQMMNRLVHCQNGLQQINQLAERMLEKYNDSKINVIQNRATKTQIQRNYLRIQNLLYLRDVTNNFMSMQAINRVQDWKLFPKYNILTPPQTNTKYHKMCLSVNTLGFNSNSQQQQQQLNLHFGTQLPNYSAYPLHQFMSSQTTIRQSFVKYLINRQLQNKVPLIKNSHINIYKKLIQHSLNHFVSIPIQQHLNVVESDLFLSKQSNISNTHINYSQGAIKSNSLNDCLQHIVTGFLLTQSHGVIYSNKLQNNHPSIKTQIIKFYAYTLQKVMQEMYSKSIAIKIWQLDIKVNKNYKLNLALCSDIIHSNMSQNIVQSRLLHYRTREVNFCQPDLNIICMKVIQSYAYMVGFEQQTDELNYLKQIVQKLLLVLQKQQSKLSPSFIIRFFKQLTQQLTYEQINIQNVNNKTQQIQSHNNNRYLLSKQDNIMKKFIHNLLKKVKQQINISQQVYRQLVQFIINKLGKKYNQQLLLCKQNQKQHQDRYQQVYNIIHGHLIKVEYNQIRQFSFQNWEEFIIHNDDDQNYCQKQQQLQLIDRQEFYLKKNKFIQQINTRNKLLLEHQYGIGLFQQQQVKTKILISGQSVLSHKTSTILKLLQQIHVFSFGQFIQQLQSVSNSKGQTKYTNQQQQNKSLQNITICNYNNQTITPTTQCLNSNNITKCQHKWHIIDSTYNHSINGSLFYTQNKIIFQTTTNNINSSIVNMINPSIIHNVLFIHLPTQYISFQQRIQYELLNKLSDLNINQKAIVINQAINLMKVLFCNYHSSKISFYQKASELNFILVIKNYTKLIEIFATQIYEHANNNNHHKINQIKQFLLMLLYWAVYPIIYQIDFFTMLKPQHFGSQFHKPLKQLQNWHYSLSKKTWIQWVTFSDFIEQNQLNTTIVDNRNIFLPVNQSLSFMYLLKKVSSCKNCLVLSEQNQMRRSFLTNLILSKTDSIKSYLYRPSSISKIHHLLQKQVSKLTVTNEYIPTKNRKIRFIIQDINLNHFNNHQRSSQLNQYTRQYLLNLIHKNYDSKRKSFLKNVNFVVSLSNYQQNTQLELLQKENIQHSIMKQSVVIKLKEYSDESLKYIYRLYLQQFFGNTDKPYSKQVRQMTNIIIYLSISLKNNMKSFRYGNISIQKLQSVYLSLKRSTPKVIKSHEDILKLFNYEMKRQFNTIQYKINPQKGKNPKKDGKRQFNDLYVVRYNQSQLNTNNNVVHQDNFIFPSCYNKVLNQMIEKLFFTQQLQKHRTQLGLEQFDLQKIQNIRNFLSTQKTSLMTIDKHNNNKIHNKFTNKQAIFTRINIPENTTQYKQLYKCYENGMQKLSQIIQNNLSLIYLSQRSQQHQQPKQELSLFLSKQLVSDVIKLMRVYTLENNHALILSNDINQIKSLTLMATKLYFNHAIALNIIQLHHNISIKHELIKLLKCKFKQHLKLNINNKSNNQYQQNKIPILIIIPQIVSQTTYTDLQLLNEYLQTGQFLSLLMNDKNNNNKHANNNNKKHANNNNKKHVNNNNKKHANNNNKSHNSLLMNQLKIKSLQSQKYLKFKSFCQNKIHFIFGIKKSNQQQIQQIFQTFPTLTKKINVNLQLSSISDQSKIQLSIKSTMSILPTKLAQQSSYLLPFRLFKIYEQFIQKYTHQNSTKNNYNILYPRFCQLLNRNLKSNLTNLQQNITIRKQTINNINQIFQFKKYLQRKLQRLKNKSIQMKTQHHQKSIVLKQLQIVRNQKHQIFRTQQHIYETQLNKCNELKLIVDEQTSKVGPILQKAQLVLQKVTRDDINQLRSFPNPPLPASKVCQSLIFLFDQVHLIKQKVIQGGQKIKDFWQYAKKSILNDKLVKRISDINQDTIKNLQSQVIQTVRQITSKPQLSQERVFKASSAAGNLSLFIRAVISTYDAIQMIQPKKKQLFDAQSLGQQLNKEMQSKKDDYQNAKNKVSKQNQLIQKSLQQLSKLNDQISTITQQIQNIQSLINHLNNYKQVWTEQIMMLQTQQSLKMFYYSIWSAFQQVYLSFFTQQQIREFVSQFIRESYQSQQSEEIQSRFEEFFINIVLKDEQVPIDIKIQADSIINVKQFQHLTTLIQNLAHFEIPFSQNEGYLNKLSSIFDNIKTFNKQDVKSYWIVDETLSLKTLLTDMLRFNNSQLSGIFNFKIVQTIDCLEFRKFDEYMKKTKRVDENKNIYQFQQYFDEQSDQQEEDQLVQNLKQHQQNISMKSVAIIKNFEHSTLNIQRDLSRIINVLTQQDKIVIFLTDYNNHCLQRQLSQLIDIKVKIDLSQTVFINLLINKVNFIKLENTLFYKTVNEIKRIKDHQLIVLNKLRTQKSNSNNNKIDKYLVATKSIQQMLQNNQQVLKLCVDFKLMNVDKLIIKQIKSKRLINNKLSKTDEQLKQWLKNIYDNKIKLNQKQLIENVGIQRSCNNHHGQSNRQPISSTIIMRQLNHGYWQFYQLVDEYLMYEVFEQMRLNSEGQSQEQIDILIDKYLNTIQSHTQISEIMKFRLFLQNREQNKYLSNYDNKCQQLGYKYEKIMFGSIINCIVLDQKLSSSSSTNIIQTLKLTYQDKLFILQPTHLYHQFQQYKQYPIELLNTISFHYINQSQVVILVDNLFNLNKILTLLRQQIQKLIYKKCVQEKDMEYNDLLTYLHQQQEFRIIVFIEQQQQKQQSMQNQKHQCKLIHPQMIDTHQQYFCIPNISVNKSAQTQQFQNNQHTTKPSTITIKNIFKHLQTTDKHSIIIKQHLQTKFYEF